MYLLDDRDLDHGRRDPLYMLIMVSLTYWSCCVRNYSIIKAKLCMCVYLCLLRFDADTAGQIRMKFNTQIGVIHRLLLDS